MIKRNILAHLMEHLASDQMTILIGPRQVGKTYLMQLMKKALDGQGKKTLWLNLDTEEDTVKMTSQETLLSHIALSVGREKAYIFIDEIQRKENVGIFLKGLFDMGLPYKFIISESGSLELKANISESMAGRKQMFSVDPVSLEEFINYRTNYVYEDRQIDFFELEQGKTQRLLSEYMVFGGYPRVVLAQTADEKQAQMQEIYRSYIDRDIRAFLHVDKTDEFTNLLKIMASQIGGIVQYTELQSTVGLDGKTVRRYLSYLEQTFILKKVTPYYKNTRSEVTKAPMYYFIDIGLRNWLLGLFGLPEIPPPLGGHVFENIVFHLLKERVKLRPTTIHFWRSRDQAEVDFVLSTGMEVIPIEVKYTRLTKPIIGRSLRSFIARYHPHHAYIVHLGERMEQAIDATLVHMIPFTDLITNRSLLIH